MNEVCFVRVGVKTYRMVDLQEQCWMRCACVCVCVCDWEEVQGTSKEIHVNLHTEYEAACWVLNCAVSTIWMFDAR